MSIIEDNINFVKDNIKKACEKVNRSPEEVNLIAVTKTIDAERINTALRTSIKNIGENKVQEIMEKYDKIECEPNWHLIGHLQTNKVKYIIDKVDMIHSVDSIKLAKEIDKRAKKVSRVMDVLVQVNIADEDTKFGLAEDELDGFIKEISILENVRVQGLMAIVPYVIDPEDVREHFRKMKDIFDRLKNSTFKNVYMNYLSMGMTNDYMVAIEEGANMVRVGTGIFGERDYSK
ncbi:YggS family pyridoxal phosphate-dependent enzyme [Wukongibacter baidiensis]|uniref:YggS family pyridoxal phosphate-dependent enzyme n=1 Tax=Wukongibacter baidiensis TaxID=1723361 RepID=UPI003D7FF029